MTLDRLHSALTTYLAQHSPERPVRSLGPLTGLTGGWAGELYTFTIHHAEPGDAPATTAVLKMYPPDARGGEHATREWRALTFLRGVNYSVPRAFLLEPDARHVGRPFIVMDHVPGTSLWRAFEAGDPGARARLTQSFVAQLVALHALDPRLLDSAAVPTNPYGYIEGELERLRRDGANSTHAMPAALLQWLEQRAPAVPCARPAILHRDYHPWNVLIDATDHLWVVDWDWQIGDARFDLAWTCTLMQRSGFPAFSGAVRDEYAQQSDHTIDDLGYFEVLTTARWLSNVLPAVEPDVESGEPARADFRAFLVDPVREARTLLRERTGIDVDIRI